MKRYFPPVKVSDSWLAWMFCNPLEVRLCPASVACAWSGWLLSLKNSKSGTDRTQVLCYHTPIKMSLIWGIQETKEWQCRYSEAFSQPGEHPDARNMFFLKIKWYGVSLQCKGKVRLFSLKGNVCFCLFCYKDYEDCIKTDLSWHMQHNSEHCKET